MATATESNVLEAQPRTPGNKNVARRVRRDGKIPAVLYGAGKDSLSVTVDPRQVLRILNSETGHNTIFDLALEKDKTKAMIVDWQYEPIKGALLATPPDITRPLPAGYPTPDDLQAGGWLPVPRNRLPFPSLLTRNRTFLRSAGDIPGR